MNLEQLVTSASRVLDVGVSDTRLAEELAQAGVHRYLALVPPDEAAVLDHLPERLQARFHPLVTPEQAYRNDSDLLILRAPVARALWGIRELSTVSQIAVEVGPTAVRLESHAALALSRLLGKVQRLGVYSGGRSRFEVFSTPRQRRPRPRHYLSETLGVDGLIGRLEQEGLSYVVLRWFENLPSIEQGEDIDILVADRHLERLHEILADEPGTIPVDIYSETGLEGSDYRGMAYYPPGFATRMLERATVHPSGARVPDQEDHLHSLAYHAAYHKGADSGLSSDLVTPLERPDHDYAGVLTRVAGTLERSFPATLEGVDEALDEAGWRPPLDTLRRLADGNAWVQRRFFPTAEEATEEPPEPAAFFIRERTLSVLTRNEVLGVLESLYFEILAVRELSGPARAASAQQVRGGNWGRGPFPVSGGEPVMMVVAAHYGPRRPNRALLARYPRLTNDHVLKAKLAMRDLVMDRVGADRAFNAVHSSDDEFETWEYVAIALPDELAALQEELRRRRDDYRTTAPVLSVLRKGRRARVEVVEGQDGQPVVRKTFAPLGRRHLEREIATMRELAPRVDAVPRLLRTGPNWFETQLFDNTLAELPDRPDGRLVPLRVARAMIQVLREVHAQGYDLVDAKPQNFLLEPNGRLRLVDYEFSHRYQGEPPDFEHIYSFVGPPDGYDGDLPVGELSYEGQWQPFVGLSRDSLLHDPVWRQRLKRGTFRVAHVGRTPLRLAKSGAQHGRTGLREGRAWAGARYRRWASERARIPL